MDAARRRLALLLLAPLVAVPLVAAFFIPCHAASSIDSRTHIEMIRGIALHGLPWAYNGPLGRWPELQVPWNIVRDGRLWGTYPPLFAYTAAPFFMVAGLRAVTALSCVLLALFAFGIFKLGKQYTGDPLLGTAAAYVAIATTPIAASAIDIGPYMLCVSLVVWAAYFTLLALDDSSRQAHVRAGIAGLLGALSCTAHLLAFPMLVAMVAILFFAPRSGEPSVVRVAPLDRIGPTRQSLGRGAAAAALAGVPLLGLAALNELRFGSPNPLSYGPCAWRRCGETGLWAQSAPSMLAYATPVLAVVAGAAIVAYAMRRWRYAPLGVGAATLAFFAWSHGMLHEHASRLFTIAWAYFVDTSNVTMPPMVPASDGLGTLWGLYVVKATLQSTPIFGFVAAAPLTLSRDRRNTLALALPVAALFALLAMRAAIPETVHALGFPWLHMRYAAPAWPLLAVLSVGALKALPWKKSYLMASVILAVALVVLLALGENDLALARRFLILRVSLLLAFTGALAAWMYRRRASAGLERLQLATACIALACGCGFSWGIDFNSIWAARSRDDALVDSLARQTPQRFAMVGYAREIDIPLTLRATRDLEYADLLESRDWANFRQLIDYWTADNRPIFALLPEDWRGQSPWPDVSFDLLDADRHLFRVTKR
jgi:TM2 domain-containing membrane protein YozV